MFQVVMQTLIIEMWETLQNHDFDAEIIAIASIKSLN